VLVTETAVLFGFHPVRMILFFFCSVVVTLLAFCASQSDFVAHMLNLTFVLTRLTNCPAHKKYRFADLHKA